MAEVAKQKTGESNYGKAILGHAKIVRANDADSADEVPANVVAFPGAR